MLSLMNRWSALMLALACACALALSGCPDETVDKIWRVRLEGIFHRVYVPGARFNHCAHALKVFGPLV